MIFCTAMWHGKHLKEVELLNVANLDFAEDDELVKEIKAGYDFIRNKLITKGFNALTGRNGRWVQPRTKGPGHESTSRAFYARKRFVDIILGLDSG